MKNRWLINIVLILVVALLGTIIMYKPGKDTADKEVPLSNIITDKIGHIELIRTNLSNIALVKTEQGWQLAKPFRARANEYNVNSLLQIAHAKVEPGFSVTDHDLEKFGLKKPAIVLQLGDTKISMGRQHPLKNARYVLFNEKIYVIPMHEIRIAENSENDFINTRLFDKDIKLASLSLPALKLAETNGNWKILSNIKKFGKSTADNINDFIAEWEHASALVVMPYSGRHSIGKIRIAYKHSTGQNKKLTLDILSHKPEFVLFRKDEGLEYHFPQETGRRLLEPQQPQGNSGNTRQ